MKSAIIKDTQFQKIGDSIKPDRKKRVVLPGKIREGITYHVYENDLGQIVLDPQATIPAYELWLFEDNKLLASLDKGMAESANKQTKNRGSFAKYIEDEV